MTGRVRTPTDKDRARGRGRYAQDEEFRNRKNEYLRQYRSDPENKESAKSYNKTYRASPEAKKRRKERRSTDESRAARRAYAWEYRSRPEVVERRRELDAIRNSTPEARTRNRHRHIKGKYNLSPEDFDRLLALQGGKCAICGSTEPKALHWHIDHNHQSGEVRGILCATCNTGLGRFGDDPELLRRAAAYLEARK